MKCQSRFKKIDLMKYRIEEAAQRAMAEIEHASNVRVLDVGRDDAWVQVEYDWPDDVSNFDATDILRPLGLELVKGWREPAVDRLQ